MILVLLVFYVALVVTLTGVETSFLLMDYEYATEYLLLSPIRIHENTEMNIVGCIMVWVVLGVMSPIVFIGKILYLLSHIGRRYK